MPRQAPKRLDAGQLLDYALKTLGGSSQSMGQLRTKLRRRAAEPGDVDAVMLKLKEAGYLNDRRFAENFAAARLRNDGFGGMRVLRDLRQRQVAPKLAEQVVRKTFEDTDELALAEAFLVRKYRGKALPQFLAEQKNLMAAFRRLRYAGFSAGASIRALKRHASKAEELEALESDPGEDAG
jgi:regulatory protein